MAITTMIDRTQGGGKLTGASGDLALGTVLVYLDTGLLDEGNNIAGSIFAGILKADATSGDDVEFYKDTAFIYNTGAAAQTDVGVKVYAGAGGIVTLAAGNGVVIGYITNCVVGVSWEVTPYTIA